MRRSSLLALSLALAAAGIAPGCVERKVTLRSDPPGATVWLDGERLEGTTPVEIPMEWDGLRRVTMDLPGHRRLESTAEVEDRWHDWFPADVFAHFLYPGTVSDHQTFSYTLERYHPSDEPFTPEQTAEIERRSREVLARAAAHRRGGENGPVQGSEPEAVDEPPPPPPPAAAPEGPPPPPPPR